MKHSVCGCECVQVIACAQVDQNLVCLCEQNLFVCVRVCVRVRFVIAIGWFVLDCQDVHKSHAELRVNLGALHIHHALSHPVRY